MNELEILLRERLLHGPMTFAEYQEEALYHPDLGYYPREVNEADGEATS